MTQVDFYILSQPTSDGRELLACKLAEKAYHKGHYLYIHTENAQQAKRIDELLWTFKEHSFIPHCLIEDAENTSAQILIGHDAEPPLESDVMINMANQVPLFFSRFLRVAEVVGGDEVQKHQARDRFRFYRDRGYPLNSHNISLQD
jgi:DNA polymerase-3 subunit chi